tara:strand:+ start:605 stop:760 length:156 start_codon:yes stop_codon:yes gene_type:complete
MGFIGAVVALSQNFMGWVKMSKEEFANNEQPYVGPSCSQAGRCSSLSASYG